MIAMRVLGSLLVVLSAVIVITAIAAAGTESGQSIEIYNQVCTIGLIAWVVDLVAMGLMCLWTD